MGNLASVRRALEECGATVEVSASPAALEAARHIILPGVGAFADGMSALRRHGWIGPLRQAALVRGIPLLGVCLGMQLLADRGTEGGATEGLGLIPGRVERLTPADPDERIPHVGWNEVHQRRPSFLWYEIRDGSDFYFVHSYHFVPADDAHILGTTPYCGRFVSAVGHSGVVGTQFHPEKSQASGLQLLRNFLGA
jgi:glutamine amidotransferase